MTLATHAAVGAIVAVKFPQHPILAFCLAFVSHFALDAIPHWDYHPASLNLDESDSMKTRMPISWKLIIDALQIGSDFLIGAVVAAVLFWNNHLILALAGAFAGALPDGLQFVYFQFPESPIKYLQRFHIWVHTHHKMKNMAVWSLSFQVIFVAFVYLILR